MVRFNIHDTTVQAEIIRAAARIVVAKLDKADISAAAVAAHAKELADALVAPDEKQAKSSR